LIRKKNSLTSTDWGEKNNTLTVLTVGRYTKSKETSLFNEFLKFPETGRSGICTPGKWDGTTDLLSTH